MNTDARTEALLANDTEAGDELLALFADHDLEAGELTLTTTGLTTTEHTASARGRTATARDLADALALLNDLLND